MTWTAIQENQKDEGTSATAEGGSRGKLLNSESPFIGRRRVYFVVPDPH
jgi:hypothetical protein